MSQNTSWVKNETYRQKIVVEIKLRVLCKCVFFSENIFHPRDNCKKYGRTWEVEEIVVDRNIMWYT